MSNRDGKQKGPAGHSEDQQGSKTHEAFIDGLHGRHGGSPESEGQPEDQATEGDAPVQGRHRLFEGRQQHDEADKNSEKNRLAKELARQGQPVEGESLNGKMGT